MPSGGLHQSLPAGRRQAAPGQKNLPEAPVLKLELEDFRASVTDSGRWTFGARSGAHDDLVLALALALWRLAPRPDVCPS
jgi:hypothetical protein